MDTTQTPKEAAAPRSGTKRLPLGDRRGRGGAGGRGGRRGPGGQRREREQREFDQKILDLSRVTRVTAGGKRMRFRATLVVGDKKGRVGIGVAKGADVAMSVEKAYRQAKRHVFTIPLKDGTFPHAVSAKYRAAMVLLKPAPAGTGLKSGGAVRVVLEMAGVPNAVSKIMGSSNKLNIARATLVGLKQLKTRAS